jgi:hypothetical protein
MKAKSGPHLQWPNIDTSNTGPTFPKDDGLASSMGPPPTQAFAPRDLREHLSLVATSEEGSAPHDLRFLHLQPTEGGLDEGRNVARVEPRCPGRIRATGQVDLCCQAVRP